MRCNSGSCNRQAVYLCEIRDLGCPPVTYTRCYCARHTGELTQGLGELISRHEGQLHEHLEVEHVNA